MSLTSRNGLIAKIRRYLSVALALAVLAGLLVLFMAPNKAYADGAVGGGGNGGSGGGGSGAWSKYGWGWARYPLCNDQDKSGNDLCGPTHTFLNGTSWATVYNACSNVSSFVDIFVVNWSDGTSEGYNYQTDWQYNGSNPYPPGPFNKGDPVDRISNIKYRATGLDDGLVAISSSPYFKFPANPAKGTALYDWYQVSNNKKTYNGYTFGQNVSWFCSSVPPPVAATCTVLPGSGSHIPINQNTTVTVTGKPKTLHWVKDGGNGYFIKQIGSTDDEQNYRQMNFNPPNKYVETVHPPPGSTSPVKYTFSISDSAGDQIGICKVQYHIDFPAGPLTITCNIGALSGLPPGKNDPHMYAVSVMVSGTGTGGTYSVTVNPSLGAHVTGANPKPITIPATPPNWSSPTPLYFSGYLDYQGSFSVSINDPLGHPVTLNPPCPGSATPVVAPYFQVWQNDVAAGGAFKNGDTCSSTTYPGYVSPSTASAVDPANKQYYGGIRANTGGTYQSKTDFGAVALGLIITKTGEGFVSPHNTLFANSGVSFVDGISGYFNSSSASPNHCAYDFYHKTQDGPPTTFSPSTLQQTDIDSCDPASLYHRCQYIKTGDLAINSLINIHQNTQETVYVSGNVTINANIMYSGTFDPADRRTIPYFTIITLGGNITLTDKARQLDGLYIAQPTISGMKVKGGDFATCDSQCTDQLIVNGAVIAQHVELLRAHGSSQSLSGGAATNIGNAPAEIFNFTPAMILGYPKFNPSQQGTPSLFSLPPVF